MVFEFTRRKFLADGALTVGALAASPCVLAAGAVTAKRVSKMQLGLVTYLWGKDWDLTTLIDNCTKSNVLGVELRSTHKHGVERELNAAQRQKVKQQFADSPVTCVGIGSNERFDNPDLAVVKQAIAATKEFIVLSHDVGGSGVKVKPDKFYDEVPKEQTTAQIGIALNELAEFGAGYGQEIRLEVHGRYNHLPDIRSILDVADHENVKVCWNSNQQDLAGEGLEHNFHLVSNRFGATCHIHELDSENYPYQELINLLVEMDYSGWLLLECSSEPSDPLAALSDQLVVFDQLVARAQST